MKKIVLIFLISFLSSFAWSQVVFNRIIEDTVAHIVSSSIALDTGYIIATGTGNPEWVRSFSIQYINNNGDRIWKKVFDFPESEVWEGHTNSLKLNNPFSCNTGVVNGLTDDKVGVFINTYDSSFEIVDSVIIEYDSIFKRAFNQTMSSNNNYYVIGQMHDNDVESGLLLVIKLDEELNTLWKKTYGHRYEYGEQIIETSDRNILVGGGTFSFPTTTTDEDWYLIKLDTAGNVIWEKGFGRGGFLNYDGPVRGLIETTDSNFVACGGYPALRSDTDTYWDGCIRKVSKDGDLMWEQFYRSYSKISNPETDYFENIISSLEYKNGELYVIGNWRSRIGRSRGYLQKLTEEGYICWNREYYAVDSISNNQYLVSFQPTQDNGFILAGYGNDYDTFGYDPPQQAWLVKTDSLGVDGLCYTDAPELNFDVEIPETVCINDTIQVYIYIAGKSAPYTVEFSTGQIIDSIYYPPTFVPIEIGLSLAEIEYGGDIIYSEQITEATLSNHEWGQCIAKPVEFHTPYYNGNSVIDITVTDAYGESKTITKSFVLTECGDNIITENICPIKLYPNPTKDKVYVDIPFEIIPQNAEFFNSAGQLIKSVNVHKGLNAMDVSVYASGNYILKINTEDESFSLSFEKE